MIKTRLGLLLSAIFAGTLLLSLFYRTCGTTSRSEIIVGRYCGECIRNCASLFHITEAGAYFDTTDSFWHRDKNHYDYFEKHKGLRVPDSFQDECRALLKTIPASITKQPGTIGHPDSFDQCGVFLQIDGKQWFIDPADHPVSFNKLVDQTMSLAEKAMSLFPQDSLRRIYFEDSINRAQGK